MSFRGKDGRRKAFRSLPSWVRHAYALLAAQAVAFRGPYRPTPTIGGTADAARVDGSRGELSAPLGQGRGRAALSGPLAPRGHHDWLKLSNSAQHVLLLHNCLSVLLQLAVRRSDSGGSPDAAAIVQALMGRISRESVGKVGEEIGMVVDVELTRETKTVTLRTGYDEELDQLRVSEYIQC